MEKWKILIRTPFTLNPVLVLLSNCTRPSSLFGALYRVRLGLTRADGRPVTLACGHTACETCMAKYLRAQTQTQAQLGTLRTNRMTCPAGNDARVSGAHVFGASVIRSISVLLSVQGMNSPFCLFDYHAYPFLLNICVFFYLCYDGICFPRVPSRTCVVKIAQYIGSSSKLFASICLEQNVS